jgi:hypothetical protein
MDNHAGARTENPRGDRAGAAAALAVLAVVVFAVVWIDLGPIHWFHHADSLLPVLASCYKWTLFFWRQNRLGALVPLLASPFRDPWINLFIQAGLNSFLGLLAIFLAARYVGGRRRWIAGGAIAALLLMCWPQPRIFNYLIAHHEYGSALGLGFAALLLLSNEDGRRGRLRFALGVGCLFCALWVNYATAITLGAVVGWRWLFGGSFGADWRSLRSAGLPQGLKSLAQKEPPKTLLMIAGVLILWLGLSLLSSHRQDYAILNLGSGQWRAYATFTANTWRHFLSGMVWKEWMAVFVVALVSLFSRAGRRALRASAVAAGSLSAAAVCHFAVIGTLGWVAQWHFNPRYATTSVIMLQCALAVFAGMQWHAVLGDRKAAIATAGLVIAMAVAVVLKFGPPSPRGVRVLLDQRFGTCTNDVLASGCTHICGNCLTVWPAIFHVNMVLHEQGNRRRVWGITDRSETTQDKWRTIPMEQWKVAVPIRVRPKNNVDRFIRYFKLPPFEEIERLTTIQVYRLRVEQAASPDTAEPRHKRRNRIPAGRSFHRKVKSVLRSSAAFASTLGRIPKNGKIHVARNRNHSCDLDNWGGLPVMVNTHIINPCTS